MLSFAVEYQCQTDLNLYDSPECARLATQAAAGRHLRVLTLSEDSGAALSVRLCEDDYPGWLMAADSGALSPAPTSYQAIAFTASEIWSRLPAVIAYTQVAMQAPNEYLWGGTIGPNYDCSGLMQAAFQSVGIWIPRDAYQQESFVHPLIITSDWANLQPGDLIFFGPAHKATHVGLYLGEGTYIHSSGQDQGRNGIGLDILSQKGDRVSCTYFEQLRGAGRVIRSYWPSGSD
jgi:cell wall-associated NlpC family hydrolase